MLLRLERKQPKPVNIAELPGVSDATILQLSRSDIQAASGIGYDFIRFH
jgi:hypothetical protein